MRFGRHLKEVIVPGHEDDCVRYDALKAAIKTQLAARWGAGGDPSDTEENAAGPSSASTAGASRHLGTYDPGGPGGRLEEGLLSSWEEEDASRRSRRRAFYAALAAEIERVSRRYDASLAEVRRKVASLIGEARRGSVLDLCVLAQPDADDATGQTTSWSMGGSAAAAAAAGGPSGDGGGGLRRRMTSPDLGEPCLHRQQVDRAFRHVYNEVTLIRHTTDLNYTGLRKIVKKFLKKTCKAVAEVGGGGEHSDAALRDELGDLLDHIPDNPHAGAGDATHPGERRSSTGGARPHGVSSDEDAAAVSEADARTRNPRTSEMDASSQRRGSSHIPLPSACPSRRLYRESATAAEAEIRHRLRALPFTRGDALAALSEQLEKAYVAFLGGVHGGDNAEAAEKIARRRLRLIERPAPPAAGSIFSFSAGVATCAVIVLGVLYIRPPASPERCPRCVQYFTACVPAFRLTAMPIVWLWCWAKVTRACGHHYVNYRFIMEVSLEEEAGWHWNRVLASVLTAAWLVAFALFSACVRFGVDPLNLSVSPAYYPLGLLVFVVMVLLFPPSSIFAVTSVTAARGGSTTMVKRVARALRRVYNPHARASLVRSIAHAAVAPFGPPVRFRDNLVADVACSLVRTLVDAVSTARFFLTGEYEKATPSLRKDFGATSPIITAVPYWFRLQQCVRRFYDAKRGSRERVEHMINAGKYTLSLLSISLASVGNYSHITDLDPRRNPGQVAWIAALLLGTLYSYAWDIVMDWGLIAVDFDNGKRRCFPRVYWAATRDRVFRTKTFYAWAMVSNLVGRFAWAVTITPHSFLPGVFFTLSGGLSDDVVATFVAVLELLRRAQWTFLRLENEYLNNSARYRSVVAAPMLLDDVGSSNWDSEWRFEREENEANTKTYAVYAVVAANALIALLVIGVFYLAYAR